MDLYDIETIKRIMAKKGLKFNKALGQNFLTRKDFLHDIVAGSGANADSIVIEIGPGLGGLTQGLAAVATKVIAIELDRTLASVLRELFIAHENVEIIQGDCLKIDLNKIIGDNHVKIVANLPYYITTPIIMKVLEEVKNVDSMTIMVQKEVAERMVALPGGKEYGALSLAVQYHCDAKIIMNVPAEAFIPPPKVDSAVVHMEILSEKKVKTPSEMFFRAIRAAFSQRRKTLVNALVGSNEYSLSKDEIRRIIIEMGLIENIRGERLSLEQFAVLAEKLGEFSGSIK
jgi:16S rRNA (adenine1518-N6/adenine1519-N6)-dimethyltransferase